MTDELKVVDIFQDGPCIQLVIDGPRKSRFNATLIGILAAPTTSQEDYGLFKQRANLAELKVEKLVTLEHNIKSVEVVFDGENLACFLIAKRFGRALEPAYHFQVILEYFVDKFKRQAQENAAIVSLKSSEAVRNLQCGSVVYMHSSLIEDGPMSFYLHPDTNNHLLKKIVLSLQKRNLERSLLPLNELPVPGMLCVTGSANKLICRARVISITGIQCQVFLIDFGISIVTQIDELRQLPRQLQVYEPLAHRFRLANADKIPRFYFKYFSSVLKNKLLSVKVLKCEKDLYFCNILINNVDVVELVVDKMFKDVPVYEKIELSCDSEYKVVVCYVNCKKLPWNFHVQLADNTNKLGDLMLQLSQVCKSLPSHSQTPTAPGMPIAAKYQEDGEWYRATVLNNTDKYTKVHYVDFGNVEEVKHEDTRPIRCDLATLLPCQAIVCRLQSADTVETAATKFEQKYCSKIYTMRVLKMLDTGELLVKMFDAFKSNITMDLIFEEAAPMQAVTLRAAAPTPGKFDLSGLPVPPIPDNIKPLRDAMLDTNPEWMRQANIKVDSPGLPEQRSDPKLRGPKAPKFSSLVELVEEKVKKFESSRQEPVENWNEDSYVPHHKYNTARKPTYNSSGTSGRDQDRYDRDRTYKASCGANQERWLHDKYYELERSFEDKSPCREANIRRRDACHAREDKMCPKSSYKKRECPPEFTIPKVQYRFIPLRISPGLKGLQVCQTYANSPWHFSLQCMEKAEELRAMMKRISVLVKADNFKLSSSELEPGIACLAKLGDIWYRAQVVNMVNDNTVKLRLVDVGITADVNIHTQVRYAAVELYELEEQSFECTLRGAMPKDGRNWSNDEVNLFQCLTTNKTLQADLIAVEDKNVYSVVLYNNKMCLNPQFGAKLECLQSRSTLSPLSLPLGSCHEVKICWFFNPSNFYLYLDSKVLERAKTHHQIEECARHSPVLLQVSKDDLVLVRIPQNQMFYRGKVIAIKEDRVKIFRFDMGDIQNCEKNQLHAMPETLLDIPAYGVKCFMSGIVPVQGKDWPCDMSRINKVFQSHTKFLMTVVSCDDAGTMGVSLTSLDNKYNVADELVKKCVAKKQQLLQEENSLEVGNSCPVFISHWEHLTLWVHRADMDKALDAMQWQLQQLALEYADRETRPGQIAAAKNPGNDKWYRVRALYNMTLASTTRVIFVDFGNTANVGSIKILPQQLAKIPVFATKCQLAIKPPAHSKTFSPGATSVIDTFETEECVNVKVYDKIDDTILVDISLSSQESLIDQLVALNLAQRMYTEAFVCHAESASKFYVHEIRHNETLSYIEKRLLAGQFEKLQHVEEVEEGMLCIARYLDDGDLYRARIISVIDNSVKVLFLDYGNTSIATELRKMPVELLSIPAVAIQCTLQHVPTTEKDIDHFLSLDFSIMYQVMLLQSNVLPWTVTLMKNGKDVSNVQTKNEDIQYFDVVVSHYESLYQFWVQKVCEEQQVAEIDITLMELKSEATGPIVGNMYAAAEAKSNGEWHRGIVEKLSPPIVHFIDYGHSGKASGFKELPQNLKEVPSLAMMCSLQTISLTHHQVVNIQALLKTQTVFQAQVKQQKGGKNCIHLFKEGKNLLDMFPVAPEVDIQTKTEFIVSHFISPREFYIHLCMEQHKLEHLALLISEAEKFEDLLLLEEDRILLTKHPNTGAWCRAFVISKTHNSVKVFLVDYGIVLVAHEFKMCPERIANLPAFARRCYVLNTPTSTTLLHKLSEILRDSRTVFVTDTCKFTDTVAVGINVYRDNMNIVDIADQYCNIVSCCEKQESTLSEARLLNLEESSGSSEEDAIVKLQHRSDSDEFLPGIPGISSILSAKKYRNMFANTHVDEDMSTSSLDMEEQERSDMYNTASYGRSVLNVSAQGLCLKPYNDQGASDETKRGATSLSDADRALSLKYSYLFKSRNFPMYNGIRH